MNTHRETLLREATNAASLPDRFAQLLIGEAPWLDGTEELNEDLGPELLAEHASVLNIATADLDRFVRRYNALVRASNNPHELRQSEAYAAFGQALSGYGREDAFGEGDYWLVSDSFSTKSPVIVVYENYRLPPDALAELQSILNQYAGVFSELRINSEEGGEVHTLRPT